MKVGIYKHYKGKLYNVIGLTLHSETREKLVLYKCLYDVTTLGKEFGKDPYFVRPYKNFNEEIDINGEKVQRFKYIGDEKYENI